MDGAGDEEHSGFSRGRDAAKLKQDIVASRKKVSFNSYNISDFKFLIGTRHIDDEDGLPYRIVGVRDHRGLIAVDRKLLHSPQIKNFDSINALDALSLTLRADPNLIVPFRFQTQENVILNKRKTKPTLSPSPTKYDKKARKATLQGAVGAWSGPLLHPTVGATPAGRTTDPTDRGPSQLCHPEPAGPLQ